MKKRMLAALSCLMMLLCLIPTVKAENDLANANVKVESYVKSTGELTLSWDAAATEGYGAEELILKNKKYDVTAVGSNKATATVEGLSSGTYAATLYFQQEGGGTSQEVEFEAVISLSTEEEMGFEFKEDTVKRSFDSATGVLTIYWNQEDAPEGTKIKGIRLDGKTYTPAEGDTPEGTVNIAGLTSKVVEPGEYDFTFLFQLPDGKSVELDAETPLRIKGTINPNLTVTVENEKIVATVTTPLKKRPVEGYTVILTIGNMSYAPQKTDKNGKIVFNVPVPENRNEVLCEGTEMTVNGITYAKCVGGLGEITVPTNPTTTRPTTPPTTSPSTTAPSTSRPTSATSTGSLLPTQPSDLDTTYPLIQGAGTTGLEGDLIAVNVSYDTHILSSFGLTENDFNSRARMLLSQELYQSLVGTGNSTVMLCMRTSSFGLDRDQISTAIHGVSKYSTYDVDQIGAVVADLGLLYIEDGTQTVLPVPEGAGEFVVQIPVPNSMKDVKLFAAASISEQGLGTLLDATVQDGFIRFTTTALGDFAILGFAEAAEGNGSQNDVPVLLVVMIIIGVLLLVGAGCLIYFFVIRKPKDDDDDLPPDDDMTILSNEDGSLLPGEEGGTVSDSLESIPGTTEAGTTDGATTEIDKAVPLVPMQDLLKDTKPAADTPKVQPLDDSRDIYSSDSKRPGANRAEDVSLGSFQEQGQQQRNKKPSDYDIDL